MLTIAKAGAMGDALPSEMAKVEGGYEPESVDFEDMIRSAGGSGPTLPR